MSNTYLENLIDSNISLMDQMQSLISSLPTDRYVKNQRPYFESTLGKHVRHIVDHYLCFQEGFKTGVINYDQRMRNCQLELDRDYSLAIIREITLFLQSIKDNDSIQKPIHVVICNDTTDPVGDLSHSSIGRELQFLQGHCVHHFALLAVMLRISGDKVDKDFGVAPSTIVYEKSVKESA